MKLWLARDEELNLIDIFTQKPLWDGSQWDQDGDYSAVLVLNDAELLLPKIPQGNELIEVEIEWGAATIIKPTTEEDV
jgi:hypothetical protein